MFGNERTILIYRSLDIRILHSNVERRELPKESEHRKAIVSRMQTRVSIVVTDDVERDPTERRFHGPPGTGAAEQ